MDTLTLPVWPEQALEPFAKARLDAAAAEGPRRIQSWYDRGFLFYSDTDTRSTHLKPIGGVP